MKINHFYKVLIIFLLLNTSLVGATKMSMEELTKNLKSDNSEVRKKTISSIRNGDFRGEDSQILFETLASCLDVPPTKMNSDYGLLIEYIGRSLHKEAKPLIPKLLNLAQSTKAKSYLRRKAVTTIGRIITDEKVIVDAIIALEKDPDINFRRGVLETLGDMGAIAESSIPMLTRNLKEDEYLSEPAFLALGKIEQSLHPMTLDEAITFLLKMGSKRTYAKLSAALQQIEKHTKEVAYLSQIGEIRNTITELISADEKIYIQNLAINTLYSLKIQGDEKTVIALDSALNRGLRTNLLNYAFMIATSKGNPKILSLLEKGINQYRPDKEPYKWKLYLNALSYQGMRAKHLTDILVKDIFIYEQYIKKSSSKPPMELKKSLFIK